MTKPTSDYEALVLALTLAIRAPSEEQYHQVMEMADYFSERMTLVDVKRASDYLDGLLTEAGV